MKERPVLFAGPMVRAILSGAKTQTRRVVKPDWTVEDVRAGEWWAPARLVHKPTCQRSHCETVDDSELACGGYEFTKKGAPRSPYGAPGDRLWVKETWSAPPASTEKPTELSYLTPIRYAADGAVRGVSKRFVDAEGLIAIGKLRPSIFMPRWASRIALEVTGVRVERLHDIRDDDAKAEGVAREYGRDVPAAMGGGVETWRDYEDPEGWVTSPRASFVSLWRSFNGAESWAANPWVWVIEFRRVQP